MSYSEENGQVTLTISREDYDCLLMCLGSAALELVNRLNQGNPNYRPYLREDFEGWGLTVWTEEEYTEMGRKIGKVLDEGCKRLRDAEKVKP